MHALPIIKSFVAGDALAGVLGSHYGLGSVTCQLMTATMRDVYLVAGSRQRYIFYLYRAGLRSREQIAAEWQFVAYLARHGVPVAPAVTTAGGAVLELQLPEGSRYGVLTLFVAGHNLRQHSTTAAVHSYGRHIATIHRLADELAVPPARPAQDVEAILASALEAAERALFDRPDAVSYLQASAAVLRPRLARLSRAAPAYGLIHGDVIRTNALVDAHGGVTVLDFDLCGVGWRAYDVASYLLTIRDTPDETRFADAFLGGYAAVRALSAEEQAALPLFEAARAMFEIGVPARYVDTWGSAYLYGWLEQSLEKLRRCMERLDG